MIFSKYTEKPLDIIQDPFMIFKKTNSPEGGHKGKYLNIKKAIYDKLTQRWKAKNISSKIRTRQGCPLSPLLFNIVLKVLTIDIRQEKEIKGIKIRKKYHC